MGTAIHSDKTDGGLAGGSGLMSGSLLKSPAFKVVAGVLTGGAAGAGTALLSSKNPNAGAALGAAQQFGGGGGADTSYTDNNFSMPEIGSRYDGGAMDRALGSYDYGSSYNMPDPYGAMGPMSAMNRRMSQYGY